MSTPGRTIVFDFDGTVSLGDGPVLRYAHHVAETLAVDARPGFAAGVAAGLRDVGCASGAVDGYALVQGLAADHGVPARLLSAAFLASRAELGGPHAPVLAPTGLAPFLRGVAGRVRRVLVTNSPAVRIPEALAALGLDDAFDEVVTGAGKPGGMDAVLDRVDPGPAAGLSADRLLSVGDLWVNDLEPAHVRGFSTALVGPGSSADARPTFRAASVADLYADIDAWLAGAATDPSSPHPAPTAAPHGKQMHA
ncbi:FMN phosphatase YigB (HAD superfamily) [Clavibacter michiganensis]|uniref:HAD family hydrolase n=1 Tax=Clavibacter michiganensis TaxID=28447 RepID=UPI00195B01A1|nr:HAD family hydrolase [Clavibacter michiganensis]MBM7411388.1 FMN phosphatase YigB (HAD superfamily) [Clavibacter michiganensis]